MAWRSSATRCACRWRTARSRRGCSPATSTGTCRPRSEARFSSRRVARELVVIDTARREDTPTERRERRILNDGSQHEVYKRYLFAEQLASEIGGEPLLDGRWFVAARVAWPARESGSEASLRAGGAAQLRGADEVREQGTRVSLARYRR